MRRLLAFSIGITSSTMSNVIWRVGPMASRLSIAVYRWRISCRTSASVTRRCSDAIRRSKDLCLGLMRMRRSHQVHRDVGIDEDQIPYPRSISVSIWLTSAVGNAYSAPRRTAFTLISGSVTDRRARASRSARRTHSPTVKCSRLASCWMSDISGSGSKT